MDAAVAALLGAAIGAVASVGGAWLQLRAQTRRELAKTAADLAMADHERDLELLKMHGGTIAPMSAYLAYHADVLRAVADGTLDPKKFREIDERQKALITAIHESRTGGGRAR